MTDAQLSRSLRRPGTDGPYDLAISGHSVPYALALRGSNRLETAWRHIDKRLCPIMRHSLRLFALGSSSRILT